VIALLVPLRIAFRVFFLSIATSQTPLQEGIVGHVAWGRLPRQMSPNQLASTGGHFIATHNLTNAYHTDQSLSNVEVLIENKGDAAVSRQCGGQRVDDRS
jgi:hypothetical protein